MVTVPSGGTSSLTSKISRDICLVVIPSIQSVEALKRRYCMRLKMPFVRVWVFLGALLLIASGSTNAQTAPSGSGSVTFTVTAVGKKESAPPIAKDDVQLFQRKERKQIGYWKKDCKLFLFILID